MVTDSSESDPLSAPKTAVLFPNATAGTVNPIVRMNDSRLFKLLIHFFPFKVIYSLFFNTSRQTVSSLYSKKKSVASFATDFFENLRFSYFSFFSEESSPEAYAPTIFQESSSCFFSFSWISCFSSPVSSTFLENASSISGIISAYTFFINAF